jgi:hypothetical protein
MLSDGVHLLDPEVDGGASWLVSAAQVLVHVVVGATSPNIAQDNGAG